MIAPLHITTDHGRRLVVPPVLDTDTHAPIWAHSSTDTTCTQLTPDQLRDLARHLLDVADHIDPHPTHTNGAPPCPTPASKPSSSPHTSSSPA